ncbi:MAG: thiol-disulfide oxidoreductase DCC family protein [Bacteroidota bacterium]
MKEKQITSSQYDRIQKADYSLVLFDGVCNFCNSSINFIIDRDHRNYFRFTSLQSELGKKTLKKYALPNDLSSIILVDNDKAYTKSTAILKIGAKLGSFWKFLYIFMFIPANIRDRIYSWIAKNRYKWFGKKETICEVPTLEVRQRFLS